MPRAAQKEVVCKRCKNDQKEHCSESGHYAAAAVTTLRAAKPEVDEENWAAEQSQNQKYNDKQCQNVDVLNHILSLMSNAHHFIIPRAE